MEAPLRYSNWSPQEEYGAMLSSTPTVNSIAMLSNTDLSRVDPLAMNLLVARELPALAALDITLYQGMADRWAREVKRRLPAEEEQFYRSPRDWKNDLAFFRLGVLCWYVDEVLGIRYREDQKDLRWVAYTDPSDLFLNGVMDTRRGTCGNMATLHVALGWRLGWPVSLACAGWHVFCRYDDGRVQHNIEPTNNGRGGFHSHPDSYYQAQWNVPEQAIACGSDLTALRPRQLLGGFVALRARHWQDVGERQRAREDYQAALSLFPESRLLRRKVAEDGRWVT